MLLIQFIIIRGKDKRELYLHGKIFIYICISLTYRKTQQNNVSLGTNIIEITENKMTK